MKQKRSLSLIPWILLLVCSAVYVSLIFNQNVWMDEAFTASLVRTDMAGVIHSSMLDTLPPLYNIILKLMTDLLGYRIPVMKLTSVLPMIFTMLLGATTVRKRHGLLTGCIWMLCLTCMPLMLHFGIEIRMYSLGFFFATASGVYAYEVICESCPKNWILFTLFSVLAGYSHHFAFVSVGVVYFFLLLYYLIRERQHLKRWLFCLLATFLLYLPCLLITLKQISRVSGYFSMPDVTLSVFVKYMIYPFITGQTVLSVLLLSSMLALLCFRLFTTIRALKKNRDAVDASDVYAMLCLLPYYFVLLFGTVISKIMTANIFVDRYLFFSCGLLWLFFAIEVPHLPAVSVFKKQLPLSFAALILVLLTGVAVYRGEWKQEYSVDPSPMISYLEEQVSPGDGLLAVADSEALYWCLKFYSPDLTAYTSPEKAMKALEEGDCNRLWVAVEEGSMVPGSLPEPETAGEFAFDRYRFTLYRLR